MQKILKLLKIRNNNPDNSLIHLAKRLMCSGGGCIYKHEQLIIYPAVNQAINFIGGIKLLSQNNNFIGVIALVRGLIETTMVLVYGCTVPKKDDFYEEFIKNGRIMRWSESNKKWKKLRDEDLISHFEQTTGLMVRQTYNNCCDILHFSTAQAKIIVKKSGLKNGLFESMIGENSPNVSKEKYDEIIKFVNDCEDIFGEYLQAMIVEKEAKTKKE